MSAAWEMDLPQSEKMVLLCLCDHANDEGVCWPSREGLSKKCSVSIPTVKRAIKSLENKGIIIRDRRMHQTWICHIDLTAQSEPSMTAQSEPPEGSSAHVGGFTVNPKPSRTINKPSESEFDFSDFQESWNEVAGECDLPKLVKATTARKRAFNARRKEFPEIECWQSAFRTLRNSKFLRGEVKPDWRADPDFFLQPKSFTKCVEGSYV